MSEGIYIHGTEPSEQERLAGLNRITNAAFIQFLNVGDGSHVLEVGSGLGLLAVDVADAAAGVHVVGVEISAAQIAAAPSHPRVTFVQGDAHSLDLPDAGFDLVYARYLLEHVADPERVLREMRRCAKPGGRVAVCENDVSLLRFDPPCPAFDRISAIPSTVLTASSMTCVIETSTSSGEAPGKFVRIETVGSSTSGCLSISSWK